MLRISAITLLFCGFVSIGLAQDSAKKAGVIKHTTPKVTTYQKPQAKPAAIVQAAKPVPAIKQEILAPAAVNLDKSLNGQYQYMLTKLYHYQQPFAAELWRNTIDTLNINRKQLKVSQAKIIAQGKIIDSLKADVTTKDQTLAEANGRVNSVSLLGMPVTKATYNLIMWGLVIVFGVVAAIVLARSGSYSREAKHRTQLYNDLEEEFKTYKAKANDKEKKLARELQTERNKVDELMGRG